MEAGENVRENNFTYQLCIRIKYTPSSPDPCTASTSVHGLPLCVCVCGRASHTYVCGTDKAIQLSMKRKDRNTKQMFVWFVECSNYSIVPPPLLPSWPPWSRAACSKLECRNDVLVICLNCKWHGLLIEKLNHLLGPQIVIRRFGYDFRL